MSIVAAFAVPHPPLIIPGVGSGKEKISATIAAYDEVGRRIAELAPDTVVISSPHAIMYADYIHISPGRGARGGRKLRPLWGVAAAAAVVLGVFFYAEYLRKPYCYIDGVAIYDKEAAMQATVYLQGLSDFGDQVRMVDELIINE